MIQQSDVAGRLRLLRYGLIVLVLVTFIVTLLAPVAALRFVADAGLAMPPITDFLGTAILFTVVVGVIAVGIYFGYSTLLKRGGDSSE
jgi:hypothetical protein